jgi:hypothetical protein
VANPNPNRNNLKPWKPGESGNPGGYSKGRRTTATLLKRMEEFNLDEMFTDVWVEQIRSGNYQFFREMLDRTEGKLASSPETDTAESIDWSELDNEGDTPPRSINTTGI